MVPWAGQEGKGGEGGRRKKRGGRARKIQGGKEGGSKGDLFTTKRRGDRWRTRRENGRER